MIFYITSRKKTIVPSQSLDSVQQQHACKDVYKFFILSKKIVIYDHKIITISHKNQIIHKKNIPKNEKGIFPCLDEIAHSFIHQNKHPI